MSQYWSRINHELNPYVPGEQPKNNEFIKLNTNENPYPPSPGVIKAINGFACNELRLYPDPECETAREEIAKHHQLSKNQVFIGNGSDEILAFGFMAFFDPGSPILFPDVTYSFYPVYSKLFGIDYQEISLDSDFSIPIEKFLIPNGGIVIANPNAPTGVCLSTDKVEEIAKNNSQSVVIVDEAYIDFGGESSIRLINSYPNLLIIQTMSKSYSLAGLRLGYALGQTDLIEGLRRIKNSFNSYTIDRIALTGVVEALKDKKYYQMTRHKVIKTRENTCKKLKDRGFEVLESKANFIFATHPDIKAEVIFNRLKEKQILVRYFKLPRIDNYLRISIGTDEEMSALIKAVDEIIKN